MESVFCSADVQSFRGSLFFQHQPTHRFRAAAQAHAFVLNLGWLLCAICISVTLAQTAVSAADAQTNRVRIEYFRPTNPALLATYELAREKRVLERLQEVFSPFRLPVDLTIKTGDCQGVSNAWYNRPAISICYEYLHEIMQSMLAGTTPEGITPGDAAIGQFFYAAAHEMGHAAFDLFDVPIFGNAEDAADQFAIYIMLHFGKEQARRLVAGAAYSYKKYVMNPQVTVPLAAFSEAHAAPAQRFYNLLCLAYGADSTLFADFADKDYLPRDRAKSCKREYDQVAFAFRDLILPHLDEQLARKVLDKTWLPEVSARSSRR